MTDGKGGLVMVEQNEIFPNEAKRGVAAIALKSLSVLIKSSKFIKLILLGASFASYALLFNWKFSLLMILSIGWHEYSHILAMRKCGIKTSGFYFIPLIGGAAVQKELADNQRDTAFIAIAGPIGGMVLSLIFLMLFFATGYPVLAAACSFNALLNIFNLVPLSPLDGSKIIKAITFSLGTIAGYIFILASLFITIFIMFKFKIWLFLFLVIVGGLETVMTILMHYKDNWLPIKMSGKEMLLTVFAYSGLGLLLFSMIFYLSQIPGADIARNFLQQ